MVHSCILIVEPDPALRVRSVESLRNEHFRILEAADGHQALSLIEAHRPELILCSQEVSGHSARELCDFVHEFSTGFVAFALVVPGSEADPEQARKQAEADVVLVRPLIAQHVATVLSLLLKVGELQTRLDHVQKEYDELHKSMQETLQQDPETRFYRFDLFKQVMLKEVKKARRYGYPVAILLLAFDNYCKVAGWLSPDNRRSLFGHLSQAVVSCIRDIDIPLRFADEKVMVVMPHTDLSRAAIVADRIRDRIGSVRPPPSLARLSITVSIAVASSEAEGEVSFGRMVQEAMQGLAEAELKGGNVVIVCAQPTRADGSDDPEPGGKLGPRTYFV